jgi:putative transposase
MPRIEFAGAFYHLTARGNNGRLIYLDERDRESFLGLFLRVSTPLGWRCHTFCLMGNHYHFLVETPRPNLAAGMVRLNGEYARSFNRRHGRRGHLFEKRYHSVVIEREAHLLEACRYVVLNPVRAGLCDTADDWVWSSFRATAGLAAVPRFLHVDWLHEQFARDTIAARDQYTAFVSEGAPAASLEGLLAA